MKETEENGQTWYPVSEAVRKTGVPSHVLRYWEDELGLTIRRTAQGHRIYSEEDLMTFRKVRDLKDKGIQLKAIRLLFEKSGEDVRLSELLGQSLYERQEQTAVKQEQTAVKQEQTAAKQEQTAAKQETAAVNQGPHEWQESIETAGDVEYEILPKSETGTYQLFETMLCGLIREAVAGQNEKLEAELADLIRSEIEELYIQLRQDMGEREAAAAQTSGMSGTEHGRISLLQKIKKRFTLK
ncbi:MAG: helix-turn-helix domain-containing protein [Lachnospiraceae bacterium]|nr:helix-turn-helix domain-containing protein [Lachnospiraceae bacterium]